MTIVYSPNTPDADTYRAGRATREIRAGCVWVNDHIPIISEMLVVWTRLGQRADERSRWSIGVPEQMSALVVNWLDTVSVSFVIVGLAVAVVLALVRRRLGAALEVLDPARATDGAAA